MDMTHFTPTLLQQLTLKFLITEKWDTKKHPPQKKEKIF